MPHVHPEWRPVFVGNDAQHLAAYSNQDDHLCGLFPITREQFICIRELFDYSDEAFANCYPVRPELWPQVIEILACPSLELDKEYFIEGTATDY
jgi:hypothetical protein